jgi:hypothetical protein
MFYSTVGGEDVSIGCFMFHFQEDPYPGGLSYKIVILEPELVQELREYFQSRSAENLGWSDTGHVFRAINLAVSAKYPYEKQANRIRFWANTIESITFGEGRVVISGICSPHQD